MYQKPYPYKEQRRMYPPYHPMSMLENEVIALREELAGRPPATATQFSPMQQALVAFVDGVEEAAAYPIEPGQAIILIAKDKSAIYEKIHDKGSWKPPELREYIYKEEEPAFVMPEIPAIDVDIGEFKEELRKDMSDVKKLLEVLVNASNNNENNNAVAEPIAESPKRVRNTKRSSNEDAGESKGNE